MIIFVYLKMSRNFRKKKNTFFVFFSLFHNTVYSFILPRRSGHQQLENYYSGDNGELTTTCFSILFPSSNHNAMIRQR